MQRNSINDESSFEKEKIYIQEIFDENKDFFVKNLNEIMEKYENFIEKLNGKFNRPNVNVTISFSLVSKMISFVIYNTFLVLRVRPDEVDKNLKEFNSILLKLNEDACKSVKYFMKNHYESHDP